jgi:5-oxoprolinase (ATP-hydrolysing)
LFLSKSGTLEIIEPASWLTGLIFDMWKFSIDTGGTFTDCIAVDPSGNDVTLKVLSSGVLPGNIISRKSSDEIIIDAKWHLDSPVLKGFEIHFPEAAGQDPIKIVEYFPDQKILVLDREIPDDSGDTFHLSSGEEAPVLCMRLLTKTPACMPLPPLEFRIGTTRGTNALLERKGSDFLLLVTEGFSDILLIDDQTRPDIFAKNVLKPNPLYSRVIEVPERIDITGRVLKSPDLKQLETRIKEAGKKGISSAGVCLLNSWKNPEHEHLVCDLLVCCGFTTISRSSELAPNIKYLSRTKTTAVNTYLQPVVDGFIKSISTQTGNRPFRIMTSSGGLKPEKGFCARDSLLSGPAGGVVGVAETAAGIGRRRVISFDMGGTSTDVSRYDNGYDYCFELQIAGLKISTPAVSIETVAAGGGSICWFDGFKLAVGPESAGADPGPACYGRGGPLTVTDINLLAGRLDPALVSIPVYPQAAFVSARAMIEEISEATGNNFTLELLIEGFLEIANEIMAGAIKKISTSKGFNPSDYVMVAFGGAGGMHACGVAELLNIRSIVVPPKAGLLSAEGIKKAQPEFIGEVEVLRPLAQVGESLESLFEELESRSRKQLAGQAVASSEIECVWKRVYIRFLGQESSLFVKNGPIPEIVSDFRDEYKRIYGHWNDSGIPEVQSIRVLVRKRPEIKGFPEVSIGEYYPGKSYSLETDSINGVQEHSVFLRSDLRPGAVINDPCLIPDQNSTLYAEKNWSARIDKQRNIVLTCEGKQEDFRGASNEDTIGLELFSRRFMGIAENMGAMLQRTAFSVNVKERLDFSCALVDHQGYLIANAPHIPVHLGSLGICVREVMKVIDFRPGDTVITNHPRFGGSHLPDIPLITPVFAGDSTQLGFVVNRAHHAEIGGITPGSMPPGAKNLEEEGVVIYPFKLVSEGRADWDRLKIILSGARYPSRLINVNLTDINAAVAANRQGERELLQLAEKGDAQTVRSYMEGLRGYSRKRMVKKLKELPPGVFEAEEYLDDGWPLRVVINQDGDRLTVDFTGSGPVHPGNLNGTRAIVESVVMYVLRLLLEEDLPLNDGLMDPVEIIVPEGILNPAFSSSLEECPAVTGGNVELSQRLTDTLIRAFGMMACSQGTMNNLVFGNEEFSYYETICGGCGAGEGFDGADAVHHHMTNTRITDPEILELRNPVRLNRFLIRKNSGGEGRFKGGNGVTREIEFLVPVTVSLSSQHRIEKPFGLNGGGPGKRGIQYRIRRDSSIEELAGSGIFSFEAGERIVIKTPGGGGWGEMNN